RLGREYERGKRRVPPSKLRDHAFEERKDQTRVVLAVVSEDQQDAANDQPDDYLKAELVPRQQTVMRTADDLQIVVRKSDGAESGGAQQGDPDVYIREVRPQERGHERRGQNQQPAHRGRAGFGTMCLRTL